MRDRRRMLALMGAGALATALRPAGLRAETAANQWFAITGDSGQPVPNLRVPVELAEDIEDLPGAVWGGPASAAIKLVEFYDYNCPWCRSANGQLGDLMRANPDLRVGLVNNPILSPASAQAAKVELALLRIKGAASAHALTDALYAAPGRIDGPRALDAAQRLGADRRELEQVADGPEVRDMLGRQMRLAASLGLVATPSFVIGGAPCSAIPDRMRWGASSPIRARVGRSGVEARFKLRNLGELASARLDDLYFLLWLDLSRSLAHARCHTQSQPTQPLTMAAFRAAGVDQAPAPWPSATAVLPISRGSRPGIRMLDSGPTRMAATTTEATGRTFKRR